MNLRDLNLAVQSLLNRGVHPLTPTDISDIYRDPALGIRVSNSAEESLREQIKETEEERDDRAKDLKAEEDKVSELEDKLREANDIINEIRSEEEPGQTLRSYKTRAEKAEENACEWQRAHDLMAEELAALRRRKGVIAGIFSHYREIMSFMRDAQTIMNDTEILALRQFKHGFGQKILDFQGKAKELSQKIQEKA